MRDVWNRFIAWLSGWPESKEERKKEVELAYLFEEEELKKKVKKKVKKKPKGLNPKKKKK